MDLVDLIGFEERKPPQMSGGQQQRVALARALVNHPKVLLLDEPLGALDLKLRKQMQLELKRIQQEVGITFIYVTHDQEEAMTMSNRLAVMRQGRIEQLGEPEYVYENPSTEFVAGFLGASNLLEGELQGDLERRRDGRPASGGGTVTLPTARIPSDADRRREGRGPAREDHDRPRRRRGARRGERRDRHASRCPPTSGSSHQYKVETPGGTTFTVYVQNLGADEAPAPGRDRRGSPGNPSTRSRWPRRRAWPSRRKTNDRPLGPPPGFDAAFARGMTQRRMSRRGALKTGGAAARRPEPVARSSPRAAAATATSAAGGRTRRWTSAPSPARTINFSNWPLYIDKAKDPDTGSGTHPRSRQFKEETGIAVNYNDEINDNA